MSSQLVSRSGFAHLKGEPGVYNVIVQPLVLEAQRGPAMGATLMVVEAQAEDGVTYLDAGKMRDNTH